ncbi:hypothetical protein Ciccas_005778 [Cichlidogyrus casuarinus]|uniref:long-chain-fatty-acid--CoA ligase n=1 Tax=Cichlidogyrus casuarinus TaxID=1844966 RepID=A0ABD2QBD5_9PLAT
MYSNTAVPLYSTLGAKAMVHIVKLTQISTCVCFDEEKAKSLLETFKTEETTVKSVILMRLKSEEKLQQLKSEFSGIRFFTMHQVRESGRKNILPYQLAKDDDLHIINFTSGTTSTPKGVMVTNGMVKRVIESAFLTKPVLRFLQQDMVHFSFLPLAHILEQLALGFTVFMKAKAGFSCGDITKIATEFKVLKPDFIPLVPRLLIRIYDKTIDQLDKRHIPRALLHYAIRSKLAAIDKYGPHCNTIWDRIFFNKIKDMLGGRVKVVLTGSATCPPDVLNFSRAAFGAIVYNGYGSTETGGPLAISCAQDLSPYHVGPPIVGIQIKLVSVPEMNLYPSGGYGRGEICARGGTCSKGYYNDEEKTRELIDKEGWMHTGDIGEWDECGNLRVVDRCKNMFKLCQGEYVAPDKVESIYLTSPYVDQVYVDGRSDKSFTIAIVCPNEDMVRKHLMSHSDRMDLEHICQSEELKTKLLKEMNAVAKAQGLMSFEMAKKLHLIHQPMTIENGLITSTLKTIRPAVRQVYKREIDQLYSSGL